MADSKVSALTAKATPTGADSVYLVDNDAAAVSKKSDVWDLALPVTGATNVLAAGMVADGSTDNSAALAALVSGTYIVPAGVYNFTATAATTMTGDLAFYGLPGAVFVADNTGSTFGTTTTNGDLWRVTTSGGPHNEFLVDGIEFHGEDLPGSTSMWLSGGTGAWAPKAAGSGSNTTAGCLNGFDMNVQHLTIRNCTWFMTDPTGTFHHWSDSGGDGACFFDLEEVRYAEFSGNRVYGTRDAGPYFAQVGTRATSDYAARFEVFNNYWEGSGVACSVKGDLIGGSVHDNKFVNCVRPLSANSGNSDVSEGCKFLNNDIDGYWHGVTLQGDGAVVEGNHFYNAGHFYDVAGTETSAHAVSTNYLIQPVCVAFEVGGGSDTPDNNVVARNYFEGLNATASTRGRLTTWGGNDPIVFKFSSADNNRCIDNIVTKSEWLYLAQDAGTAAGNLISWSTVDMIQDHTVAEYNGQSSTSIARGPSFYSELTTDWTNATTTATTVFTFAGLRSGAKYRLTGELFMWGNADDTLDDLTISWSASPTHTNGFWTLKAMQTGDNSPGDGTGWAQMQSKSFLFSESNDVGLGTAGSNKQTATMSGFIHPTAAGTLTFQAAQTGAGVGTSTQTISLGSWLELTRVS